jgi:hypothetical protein
MDAGDALRREALAAKTASFGEYTRRADDGPTEALRKRCRRDLEYPR